MQEQNQISKSSSLQWIAKQEETLSLSRKIISGETNLAIIEMGCSIEKTLSMPNIRSVFKDDNGPVAFSVVNVLTTRFIDSFGFSTKLNPSQIETLTVDTLENFAYESLEDIILFFKMARSGKFGATMKGVDSNLIFGDWFPKYLEFKSQAREVAYTKQKSEFNSVTTNVDALLKTYKRRDERVFEQKVIEFVDRITNDIDRQMLEDLIVDWSKDPERLPYISILKKKRLVIK